MEGAGDRVKSNRRDAKDAEKAGAGEPCLDWAHPATAGESTRVSGLASRYALSRDETAPESYSKTRERYQYVRCGFTVNRGNGG